MFAVGALQPGESRRSGHKYADGGSALTSTPTEACTTSAAAIVHRETLTTESGDVKGRLGSDS